MIRELLSLAAAAVLLASPAGAAEKQPETSRMPTAPELKRATARFAPVDIQADVSKLPENERRALAKMVQAAKLMDSLFLRQVWAGNETLLLDLLKDNSPLGRRGCTPSSSTRARGPGSTTTRRSSPASPPKPEAGNFYPAGATKAEIEAWVKSLPEAQQREATGFFTTIRRDPDGKLVAVPYSVEYQGELARGGASCCARPRRSPRSRR